MLSEIINGRSVFALQENDLYSVGEEAYALYSKVLQANLLIDKLNVSEKEYREGIRLLEESIRMEPYFMNRYFAADSVRQSNMLEVLGNCRHIGQLQVITDSAGIEPMKAMLKANENNRIWIAAEKNAWQNYPSLFLTDEENRAVYGLMITPRTMRLVVRYLRFIQNQYDFE